MGEETVCAYCEHSYGFLQHFLETPAYRHDLAHALHLSADAGRRVLEFREVPARELEDKVVERKFKTRRCHTRNRIFYLRQSMSEREFGRDERERISCRLGGECGRARKAGVHFDDPIITRFRMQCVLNVALADDTKVPYRLASDLAERVVFLVGEGLRRRDDGRFSRMDTHRVEVFHVAHCYAIVCRVAHDLVLDLFPSVQIFFDKNLWHRTKKRCKFLRKLRLVPYNAGAFAAKRQSR